MNDADFTDEGGKGPTRFLYCQGRQSQPSNFTAVGNGGYAVGIYPGNELEWLASYYA